MKRIIAILLILAALMTSAVSCSETPQETESESQTVSDASESASEVETEDPYASERSLFDALPKYDLEGGDFTFATQVFMGAEGEIWVDGMNGEGVNDAIYLRSSAVCDRFNCKMVRTDPESTDAVKQAVQSGDNSLMLVVPGLAESVSLARNGYLIDLLGVNNLSLTEAWYDQGTYNNQISGKLFAINGDINLADDKVTYVYLFNKEMAEDYQLGNLYDLVNEGKWTIDAMMEMSITVSEDLNGNGISDAEDSFGYLAYGDTEGFLYGSGLQWVTFDSEGMPQLTIDTDRASAVLDKLSSFFTSYRYSYVKTDSSDIFRVGRGLFLNEVVSYIPAMSDMEYDFGVLPLPKYDEEQDQYYSYLYEAASCVAIPNLDNDTDMIGAIIEAMAIQSHILVKPAFYDQALTRRHARDEESAAMLDLIFENRIYDIGYISVQYLRGFFGGLSYRGSTNLMSRYAKLEKTVKSELEKIMNDFLEH